MQTFNAFGSTRLQGVGVFCSSERIEGWGSDVQIRLCPQPLQNALDSDWPPFLLYKVLLAIIQTLRDPPVLAVHNDYQAASADVSKSLQRLPHYTRPLCPRELV